MNALLNYIRTTLTISKHGIPDEMMSNILKSPNTYDSCIPCSIAHPTRSCLQEHWYMISKPMLNMYKAFFIAHLFPVIIYKRKELRNNPLKVLKKLFISFFRSFIFLWTTGAIIPLTNCQAKISRFDGTIDFKGVFMLNMVGCLGIWAETAGRIEETMLYILSSFPKLVWIYLKKKFNVRDMPYFLNMFFALSCGLMCVACIKDDGSMKTKYKVVFDAVLDKKKNREDEKIVLEKVNQDKKSNSD